MAEGSRIRRGTKGPATLALVVTVLVTGLLAVPVIAPAAATTANATPSSGSVTGGLQAYGNVTHTSFQGNTDRGEYFGNVTYGFVVNTTEANTSANVSEITVEETVGVDLNVTYCEPNCSHPTLRLGVSYAAWETQDAWANVTTAANVTANLNGTAEVVPAVGLLDSATETRGGVTESAVAVVDSGANATTTASVMAAASYSANASVSFTPALGLFPSGGVSPGESWSSTAAFLLNAEWGAHWSIAAGGPRGTAQFNGSASRSLGPIGGNVTLFGTATPAWAYFGQNRTVSVEYRWSASGLLFVGPFAVGTINIPTAWDGDFGSSWQPYDGASAQVSFGFFELNPHASRYRAVEGASVSFAVGVSDPTGQTGANQSGVAAQSLAARPMSPSEAGSTGACLQAGNCGSNAPATASGFGLKDAALALIAAGLVAVAATVAVVALARRGRRPPAPPPAGA